MKKENMEEFFERYKTMIYRIAFTYMKNHADAEDIVQEVFLRVMKNKPILRDKEHEKAWMIRTTINICKDYWKNVWNKKTIGLESVPEVEKAYFTIPFVEEDDTLWAVMELSEKYRNAIYLFYYEDYSIREIAEILGIQENTIKTHLKRGREELKKILEK